MLDDVLFWVNVVLWSMVLVMTSVTFVCHKLYPECRMSDKRLLSDFICLAFGCLVFYVFKGI